MRKIAILSILILALLAVSVAFAAEKPEMSVYVADINVGEIAHVQITLPSDAQGNVTVSVDGQKYSANVVDGKANVDLPNLKAGDYVVKVTYPGSGNYSQIEKQADLKVLESNNNASDTNTNTSANASGAPDTNTSANASGAPDTNTAPVTPTNVTNTTDTTNNTNVTPQKNTTNNTAPVKPKKEPPKPLAGLEDKNTGLPILLLVLVVIIVVIGVALRGKK